jgi:hypothetical protein
MDNTDLWDVYLKYLNCKHEVLSHVDVVELPSGEFVPLLTCDDCGVTYFESENLTEEDIDYIKGLQS